MSKPVTSTLNLRGGRNGSTIKIVCLPFFTSSPCLCYHIVNDPERGLYKGMDTPNRPSLPNVAPVQFVREVVTELKRVTWPTRDETVKLTAVVIAISVIVAVFIGGLDAFFVKITGFLFKR